MFLLNITTKSSGHLRHIDICIWQIEMKATFATPFSMHIALYMLQNWMNVYFCNFCCHSSTSKQYKQNKKNQMQKQFKCLLCLLGNFNFYYVLIVVWNVKRKRRDTGEEGSNKWLRHVSMSIKYIIYASELNVFSPMHSVPSSFALFI